MGAWWEKADIICLLFEAKWGLSRKDAKNAKVTSNCKGRYKARHLQAETRESFKSRHSKPLVGRCKDALILCALAQFYAQAIFVMDRIYPVWNKAQPVG